MRLTYEDLEVLESELFEKYIVGILEVDTYIREWDELVVFTGWTWDEILIEIDRRWNLPVTKRRISFVCLNSQRFLTIVHLPDDRPQYNGR